jgi:hypothetical protein
MVLLGQVSLLVHVCSTDELDAEVVPELLGGGDLKRYDLFHALQVLLVPVHDDVLLATVVLLGQLLSERLNGGLHESLLSIDVEHAVSFVSQVGDLVHLLGEGLEDLEVTFGDSHTHADGNALHQALVDGSGLWVQLEQMGVGINL